ncbi:MAG: PA0069 family radical SAM protein [Kiloniellales bacterium]
MIEALPDRARRGRGAVSNRSGRYEAQQRVAVDDGWSREPDPDDAAPPLATSVLTDSTRSIIARNRSPDVPFDRSINPYRGCEHGCVYCFARPSHAWLGFSPGLDFESKFLVKPEAAKLLRAELGKAGYRPAAIALGSNTDPYQPLERRLEITRRILEVLAEARHPLIIVTKSNLVLRDLDLLSEMAKLNLVQVLLSVTTLDRKLARLMEPRAPTPARRLEAIAGLSAAGVPAGVLAAPMIPAVNDAELEAILEACAEAGAESAGYVLLRLPLEIKELFDEWLEAHFPDRKAKVLHLVEETRSGKLYDSTYGKRMRGEGVYAELLAARFKRALARLGLDRGRRTLASHHFRKPASETSQLALF